jgi:hypothetical protein
MPTLIAVTRIPTPARK